MKFIIIAAARTKSSYLVNLLNSHDSVLCHSEIFHQERVMLRLKRLSANARLFDGRWRDTYPTDFLRDVMQESLQQHPERPIIGCKLLLYAYQINRGLELLLKNKPKVIFLHRKNKLAWYSSLKIAIQTNVWATSKQIPQQAQITFNPQEYISMVENQICLDKMTLKILSDLNVEMMSLEYDEVGSLDSNQAVLNFLGVEQQSLRASSLAQNSVNLLTRFTNPGAVVNFIQSQGLSEWLN